MAEHRNTNTWRRRSDGTWAPLMRDPAKVAAPDMVDILEALEMNRPHSSSIDTSWTLREHEAFERRLRMYPRGSYEWVAGYIPTKTAAEVESYGLKCWESDKYQRALARREQAERETREFASGTRTNLPQSEDTQPSDEVKVEQSPPVSSTNVEPAVKTHQVRKWLRATFRWCIEALSFRCLRRQKYYDAEIEFGADLPDNQPTPSTSDTAFYGFVPVPIQGPAYRTGTSNRAPAAAPYFTASETRSRGKQAPSRYARAPPQWLPQPQEYHRAPPEGLYAPPQPALFDADENDDSSMRTARQAAAEIEWYDKVTEPEPASRVSKQKSGGWSKDEHERYCAGLEKYRYGSWKNIADHVGTRTESQVMSHAQSIRAKRKRAENRESLKSNKSTRTSSSAPKHNSHAAARSPTLEELLVASLTSPVPARSNSGHSESIPTTITNPPDFDPPSTDASSTPGVIRLGGGFPFCGSEDSASVQDPRRNSRDKNASIRVSQPEKCPKAKAGVDPDSPLCSPPLDILRESGLSDESLLDLLDIPPTQAT